MYINGVMIGKITAIEFTPSKEKEPIYGSGPEVRGIQSGNRRYNGQMTLYKGVIDNMNRLAVAAGGKDLLDANYVVVVAYRARGNRLIQTHTCLGLEFSNWGVGMAQNAKSQSKEMPFEFVELIST